MTMCRLYNLKPWSQLTCWQEASPVKTSVLPENGQVSSKEPEVDSGENLLDSFAQYDHSTSLWRTSQACLFSPDLALYSETWPSAGMMRNGKCYPLPPLEPHMPDDESGLWPTPTANLAHSAFSPGTAAKLQNGISKRKSGAKIGSSLKWEPRLLSAYRTNTYPNPAWLEYLMGYPYFWTELED